MRKPKIRPLNNNTVAVIGEGITETYYLQSLKGLLSCTIEPSVPKHSQGLKYLDNKIKECIYKGYSKIYCLIDMDTKVSNPQEMQRYNKFKSKYPARLVNHKGQKSEIFIVETLPCTELWFYYYFKTTSKLYQSYDTQHPLKPDLLSCLPEYEKTEKFFKKCGGLHDYITLNKGNIENAMRHASQINEDRIQTNGGGSYSEIYLFLEKHLKKQNLAMII